MTDFPYVGPPSGGLVQAMGAARSRRLRKAGTTSGVSALTLLVVALLAGQTGRTTLVQGPKTEVPAVTTTIHNVTPKNPSSTLALGPTTLTYSSSQAAPTAPRTADQAPTAVTAPTEHVSRPNTPAGPAYKAGPIQRSDTQLNVPTSCLDPQVTLCQATSYSDYGPTDAPHQLTADVCSSDANPVFLHYAGTTEIDFAVVDPKGREVWRWSAWHPLGETPHTLTLQAGDCFTWTFNWTGVDAHGTPLPKGDYSLRVRFRADELAHRAVPDYAFTLT